MKTTIYKTLQQAKTEADAIIKAKELRYNEVKEKLENELFEKQLPATITSHELLELAREHESYNELLELRDEENELYNDIIKLKNRSKAMKKALKSALSYADDIESLS